MPKDLEITIIFKRKLICDELKNLLADVGIKNVKQNNLRDICKSNSPEKLVIIELDSEKMAEEVIKLTRNKFLNIEKKIENLLYIKYKMIGNKYTLLFVFVCFMLGIYFIISTNMKNPVLNLLSKEFNNVFIVRKYERSVSKVSVGNFSWDVALKSV